MTATKTIPPRKPWFIGWAFQFVSTELNFDFFGSPIEILQELKEANIDLQHVVNHPAVQITARAVHKDGRVGKFGGGPEAPGLMQLLDTTIIKDWDAARQVLGRFPTLLTSANETASIPLCLNAALGQQEIVEFLIANGAPVNVTGKLGMTPLHWAAVHNQPAIAKILVDAGANRSALNWFMLTPANLSHANCSMEVLNLLAPGNPEKAATTIRGVMHAMGCT